MLLRVEELSKKYMTGMLGRQQYSALDQVGFTVKAGETVGLVGRAAAANRRWPGQFLA
jgi:ABC-type oligopeptide transport system ATPase subunit